MKKVIGCIMFWIAVGMLLMLIIGNEFIGIAIIAILLIVGYNLYHCG